VKGPVGIDAFLNLFLTTKKKGGEKSCIKKKKGKGSGVRTEGPSEVALIVFNVLP